VWSFVPEAFFDSRGVFSVWFDAKIFQDAVGYEFAVGQTNHSVSRLGTVRGFTSRKFRQVKESTCSARRDGLLMLQLIFE